METSRTLTESQGALFRLSRSSFGETSSFTATQALVDSGTSHFLEESARLSTFASILVGGGVGRLGRTGVLALGANATGRTAQVVQGIASLTSIGAEAIAFETTNRLTIGLISPIRPMNSWRWNGEGGLRQGFYSSFINFTAFRWAGSLSQGQNIVFQHAAQSTAMVAGHHIAGALRIIPLPENSLAEQFFEAERTNIQLASGMAALHTAAPGIHGFGRSLDLANQARMRISRPDSTRGVWETLAVETSGGLRSPTRALDTLRPTRPSQAMAMSVFRPKDGEGPMGEAPLLERGEGISREKGASSGPLSALALYEWIRKGAPDPEAEIPREEILGLSRRPGAALIPHELESQRLLIGQIALVAKETLRERFERLQGYLNDPRSLGPIFFGALNNMSGAIRMNVEFISEKLPGEKGLTFLDRSRDLPAELSEFRDAIFEALRITAPLIRVMNESHDGVFLRSAYYGKMGFGLKGMRSHYAQLYEEILPALEPSHREELGYGNIVSPREMAFGIRRLILRERDAASLFRLIQNGLPESEKGEVSRVEILSLAQLPAMALVPPGLEAQKLFVSQMSLGVTPTLQGRVEGLRKILTDPHEMSRTYGGSLANMHAAVLMDLDYLRREIPGEGISTLLDPQGRGFPASQKDAQETILSALRNAAPFIRLMNETEDGPFLRETYEKTHKIYRHLTQEIIPFLPSEQRRELGYGRLLTPEEMEFRIQALTGP